MISDNANRKAAGERSADKRCSTIQQWDINDIAGSPKRSRKRSAVMIEARASY